ncbi:MAG TPA: NUDIX hydrolase, partial [Polyangia bacterium]
MSARAFDGYEIVSDERIGDGGFLRIRRVRLCVRRSDGTLSKEGLYDFIERPMGADAVVLLLWHRAADGVRVLLRHAPRVPLYFRDPAVGAEHAEVVAGIIEAGEDGWAAIQARAAA